MIRLSTPQLSQLTGRIVEDPKLTLSISKGSENPEIYSLIKSNALKTDKNVESRIRSLCDQEPEIENVRLEREENRSKIVFQLNRQKFIENAYRNATCAKFKLDNPPKTLIEFSSPNIAKPFHAGHLRSTIIGNFLANLYDHLGHQVTKINYLGDWGTQMGYLKLGVDLKNWTKSEIQRNPIELLCQAYVHAHAQAEGNEELHLRAKQIFCDLENADSDATNAWNEFRVYTVDELKRMYNRLGISFDHYYWESQYRANDISDVISLLDSRNLLHTQDDGSRTITV